MPNAHILPHWTWPGREGQKIPVYVYSSGDEVELFVNGVSQGRRGRVKNLWRFVFDGVVYQPGELRAVAYRNGKVWCEETVQTVGAPAKLELTPECKKVAADGKNGTAILEDAMTEAGLKNLKVPTVEQVIKANAVFELALSDGTVTHMQQSAVTQIVSNCEKRAIGSGGGFGYQSALDGADVSILDSLILAHWICSETKAEKKKQSIAY